jgi:precorrin-2 methylase
MRDKKDNAVNNYFESDIIITPTTNSKKTQRGVVDEFSVYVWQLKSRHEHRMEEENKRKEAKEKVELEAKKKAEFEKMEKQKAEKEAEFKSRTRPYVSEIHLLRTIQFVQR